MRRFIDQYKYGIGETMVTFINPVKDIGPTSG